MKYNSPYSPFDYINQVRYVISMMLGKNPTIGIDSKTKQDLDIIYDVLSSDDTLDFTLDIKFPDLLNSENSKSFLNKIKDLILGEPQHVDVYAFGGYVVKVKLPNSHELFECWEKVSNRSALIQELLVEAISGLNMFKRIKFLSDIEVKSVSVYVKNNDDIMEILLK